MNPELIVYPAICMFLLTIGCIYFLGFSRYRAIHNKEVRISFYRTYDEGAQPARLHLLARHVQNHFEVPPLFYLVVIFTYLLDAVSLAALCLAWAFVGARCVHSCIHLGNNNVSRRFFAFGFSLLCLTGLWLLLLAALLTNGP